MKLIYSHLQKLLPTLSVAPQKLRDDLTMIGHFTNFYEEIDNEIVFDLDIKINRGDCLGYYGLARDLSIFYDIPLTIPHSNLSTTDYQLPITITSPDVTRVMCLKISNIKVTKSPDWLVKFTQIHGVNSVNNIVDLTNYVMFMYGIPNHAFDATVCGDQIIWENNNGKTTEFITLDGTTLKLSAQNLVISNPQEVLSTDLVGGKKSGTYDNTTEIIIEVATYNRVRIRLDSKELKTVTEASIRLEKDLDPDTIPLALNQLAALIVEHSGGQISSSIYDYYPNHIIPTPINFDFESPSRISGVNIPTDFSVNILKKLDCTIKETIVTPPTIRKDITLSEDLAEEVVRFYGYNKIPTIRPLEYKQIPDITPPVLYQIEKLKDKLVSEGYDEVLSWPLVSSPLDEKTAIYTQNSINSEYPVLRQSIIQSLKVQLDNYQRYKVPSPKFFEIGKIYYQENGKYIEKYALGVYNPSPEELMNNIKKIIASRVLGGWPEAGGVNFFETILDDQEKSEIHVPQTISNTAIELTSQIITLDANVTLPSPQDPLKLIEEYSSKIDKNILWSMQITDIFKDKYTFRVSYYNCNDKTAKKIHLLTFNLN